MRVASLFAVAFALRLLGAASAVSAQARAPGQPLSWITLGTQGGPIPNAQRSQPANLLVVAGKPWLVDCGEGALERLAMAGYQLPQVNTLLISHLHMDHVGSLQGLIGLRWFGSSQPKLLTIYGPPGTEAVVAGILQALKPVVRIGLGVAGANELTPEAITKVVIIQDGSDFTVDGVRVRAVRNSHFDSPPGHPAADGSQSLSYRFDYQGYSIGYTGDTGPSEAVVRLEQGVSLLVSEVEDLPAMMAALNEVKLLTPLAKQATSEHFQTQHLTPQEAGKLAAAAGAKRLVFTHLSITGPTDAAAPALIRDAHTSFKGPVLVAHDLDKF